MNEKNKNITESAVEYIEKLSQKTITPITGYNIINNSVIVFYDSEELKKKADDHGTTELLKEMFFKYLSDKGFDDEENPELYFKAKNDKN